MIFMEDLRRTRLQPGWIPFGKEAESRLASLIAGKDVDGL
jgi:hypothetical protein